MKHIWMLIAALIALSAVVSPCEATGNSEDQRFSHFRVLLKDGSP